MSEDVSATMRVGITVILVAALVATVLNLMVMSNSLLSGGQSTLQSGIDSITQQEFAGFNNVRVTGTQVQTALSLFQGRDIAIVVQTKSLAARNTNYASKALNYGALLANVDGNGNATAPARLSNTDNGDGTAICGSTSKVAYAITFGDTTGTIKQVAGDSFYRGTLYSENGLVQSNYDIGATTQLSTP